MSFLEKCGGLTFQEFMILGGRVKVVSKIRSQSHSNRMLMLMYDNTIFMHEENVVLQDLDF
jgi:hypothetical protein